MTHHVIYLFIYVTTKYIYDKHFGIAIHYYYMFRHAGVVKSYTDVHILSYVNGYFKRTSGNK